jgi:hypothetical protein
MYWLVALLLAVDLTSIKTEPKLEKRSELALAYADSAINKARDAYNKGDYEQSQQAVEEVGDAVDLSYQSLLATGKDPRKTSAFKEAEKATRQLLRRLDSLWDLMSSADRATVEPIQKKVSDVHDSLLKSIMSKRK